MSMLDPILKEKDREDKPRHESRLDREIDEKIKRIYESLPVESRDQIILDAAKAALKKARGGDFVKCPSCGEDRLEAEFYRGHSRKCRICGYGEWVGMTEEQRQEQITNSRAWMKEMDRMLGRSR